MTDDLEIVMVPRDLYYHEVAYVRGLEADNERLRAENDMLRSMLIDAPTKAERDELFARRALEQKP